MATAPRGLADLVTRELRALGVTELRELRAGVRFATDLRGGYHACLYSRVASRVLLEVADFQANDTDAFYAGARALDWGAHIDPHGTLACEFTGTHPTITHSQFGALKLKDAICDHLRERTGTRPSIDLDRPDVRVVAHTSGPRVLLYIDLAGDGLHRRGYRVQAGEAPLRENLAAGILLRAAWPDIAAAGGAFLDPMCGSGTLPIEAAMIAADIAPGLRREYWGFTRWRGHDAAIWRELLDEALARVRETLPNVIRGSDRDAAVLRNAAANAARAGVDKLLQFSTGAASEARAPEGVANGLVCTNPPYGARLGDDAAARAAYRELGQHVARAFSRLESCGTLRCALGRRARTRPAHLPQARSCGTARCECRLLRIDLTDPGSPGAGAGYAARARPAAGGESRVRRCSAIASPRTCGSSARPRARSVSTTTGSTTRTCPNTRSPSIAMSRRKAASCTCTCRSTRRRNPSTAAAADRRRAEALAVLPESAQVDRAHLHLRMRRRQRGTNQYERVAQQGEFTCIERVA